MDGERGRQTAAPPTTHRAFGGHMSHHGKHVATAATVDLHSAHTIRAENVAKTYGSGDTAVHALEDVTFGISRGEFVVMLGPAAISTSWAPPCPIWARMPARITASPPSASSSSSSTWCPHSPHWRTSSSWPSSPARTPRPAPGTPSSATSRQALSTSTPASTSAGAGRRLRCHGRGHRARTDGQPGLRVAGDARGLPRRRRRPRVAGRRRPTRDLRDRAAAGGRHRPRRRPGRRGGPARVSHRPPMPKRLGA